MVRMQDVAARARVSAKTVSRVFNNDPHVLPETRMRVEAALRDLNYVPNRLATAFRAGRAPIVGLAVPDLTDPRTGAIARSVGDVATARGTSVSVTSTGTDPHRERQVVEALLGQSLTGLLIAPVTDDQSWLAPWLASTPVVFVDRQPTALDADSFTQDDRGGGALATEHLLDHGHRRIAFLGDALTQPTARRLEGHRAALAGRGVAADEQLVVLDVRDRPAAAAAVEALAALPDPPTALFSSNDRCSMALVPAVQGTDLALVSFGDFPMADVLAPAVTVVDQDPAALGALAAERLFDRLDDPRGCPPQRTVLPLTLVERDSCRRPARVRA